MNTEINNSRSRTISLSRRANSHSSSPESLRRPSRDREKHYRSRSRSLRRCKSRYNCSKSRSYSPRDSRNHNRRRSHSRSPMSERRRHVGSRDNPQQSRCLGIFGLSVYTNEQNITQIFSRYGPVDRVQVVIDAKTGRSRGFCFVYFKSMEDAKVAKEQCTGMEIDGRRIRVDYSITQRAHTPTPGIYMGRPTRGYRDRNYRYRDDEYYERESNTSKSSNRYRYKDRRSPSPTYNRHCSSNNRRRYDRSRSRSYSPSDRRYRY